MEAERVSEEREEGEIIEDGLEDVSDCSIGSPLFSGKSVSPTETLRPVSLSSISDSDYEEVKFNKRLCRHVCKRKRSHFLNHKSREEYKCHRRPLKHRRKLDSGSSDSEDDKLDHRTLRQLKEAVRIETSQELHHKSLRTRLKGMIEPDTPVSRNEEDELICLHISALESHMKTDTSINSVNNNSNQTYKNLTNDSNDEKELAELRLEALKSAVLNKHQVRKKRKAAEQLRSDGSISDVKNENPDEINKENTFNKVGEEPQQQNESTSDKPGKDISIDEDPDIMRAMLLASVTHKITGVSKNTNLMQSAKKVVSAKPAVTKSNLIHRKPVQTFKSTVNINRVFRNFKTNLVTNNKKINPCTKLVTNIKPFIINVNDDSDSDVDADNSAKNKITDDLTESVTQLLKKQRAEVEANLSTLDQKIVKSQNNVINKSAVKLLPKSQQLEYRKLIRLLNAKRKLARAKKLPQKIIDNKRETFKKTPKPKLQIGNNRIQGKGKEVTSLQVQKTLQDIQMNKNGRYDVMQGKYQVLAPILQKINKISEERKKYETLIKQLLQELQIARNNYTSSNEIYKMYLQKLIQEKAAIDRIIKTSSVSCGQNLKEPHTSTPNKTTNDNLDTCDLSQIENDAALVEKTFTDNNCCDEKKEEIDVKSLQVKSSVPKYVSPLNQKPSDNVSDPLATICPYDLMGDCRDLECGFKHCS